MKVTGQLLKKARTNAELDIKEVAAVLKISSKILIAIEEAKMDELPPKTFVRGFVRSYANYLNLNIEEILNTYHKEMGTTRPQPSSSQNDSNNYNDSTDDSDEDSTDKDFSWLSSLPILKEKGKLLRYIIISLIVALIFVIIFVKNIVDKYEKERALLSSDEIAATTGVKPRPNISKKIVSIIGSKTEPTKLNDSTTSNDSLINSKIAKKNILTKINTDLPELPDRSKSKTLLNKTTKKLGAQEKQTLTPIKNSIKSKRRPQEVIVEALDHLEITFFVDNEKKKSIILRPDEVHTFKAKKSIRIEVSDAGALNIIHNGRDKGVPGNIGEEKILYYK